MRSNIDHQGYCITQLRQTSLVQEDNEDDVRRVIRRAKKCTFCWHEYSMWVDTDTTADSKMLSQQNETYTMVPTCALMLKQGSLRFD